MNPGGMRDLCITINKERGIKFVTLAHSEVPRPTLPAPKRIRLQCVKILRQKHSVSLRYVLVYPEH